MKRTATLAYLRQLCRLPLASEQIIPHALPSIVDMAKASAAVFVWQASGSRHAHLWSTADLPAAAMQRCLQRLDGRHVAAQLAQITQVGNDDKPADVTAAEAKLTDDAAWLHGLGKRARGTDGQAVSAGAICAADLVAQPDADHDILCSLGVSQLAWLLIGPAHAPVAQLVLYRERGRKPFDDETLDALRQIQHYLERALQGAQTPASPDAESGLVWVDSGEEASVLLGPGDAIIDASYLAASLMSRVTDQPATGVTDLRTMVHQLRSTCEAQRLESLKGAALLEHATRRRRAGAHPTPHTASPVGGLSFSTPASIAAEIRNPWGRFVVRFDQLSSAGLVCLSLRRQEAEVLALLRRIADEQLSPQQREVILRLGLGMSNAEIAVDLGVTEATAKTHVKLLLKRLGVKDRYRAVALMLRPPALIHDHAHT